MLFAWEALNFVSCVAGMQISLELANFASYLGLSIAFNNGVCQPAGQVEEARPSVVPFRPPFRPVFQR